MLTSLAVINLGGRETAIQSARNFRELRERGVRIRKTIDAVIATVCIQRGFVLLHSDRDFEPFAEHLGLRVAI
jgi:predicted nucleic acid-binding protein